MPSNYSFQILMVKQIVNKLKSGPIFKFLDFISLVSFQEF